AVRLIDTSLPSTSPRSRCNANETEVAWNAKGVKGDTGSAGPQGDTGATGPQGSQGDTGPQGAKGDTGATGPQGDTGTAGAPGAAGPQGRKGDTGSQGSQGPQGPQGPQGQQGPQGPAGQAGQAGGAGDVYIGQIERQGADLDPAAGYEGVARVLTVPAGSYEITGTLTAFAEYGDQEIDCYLPGTVIGGESFAAGVIGRAPTGSSTTTTQTRCPSRASP